MVWMFTAQGNFDIHVLRRISKSLNLWLYRHKLHLILWSYSFKVKPQPNAHSSVLGQSTQQTVYKVSGNNYLWQTLSHCFSFSREDTGPQRGKVVASQAGRLLHCSELQATYIWSEMLGHLLRWCFSWLCSASGLLGTRTLTTNFYLLKK